MDIGKKVPFIEKKIRQLLQISDILCIFVPDYESYEDQGPGIDGIPDYYLKFKS